jgi:hypothetical protein
VSSAAAASPFQSCPRCQLRENKAVVMVIERTPPRRFGRAGTELERIVEAKARLTGPPVRHSAGPA